MSTMFTLIITMAHIKFLGLPLIVLSLILFVTGSLPDREGNEIANAFRWVVWPATFLWFAFIFCRGMWL